MPLRLVLLAVLFGGGEGQAADEIPLAMRKEIDSAVQRGLEWLRGQQGEDGGFGEYHSSRPGRVYLAGHTGIALFTMLSCGEPKGSPAVRRAADFLLRNPPKLTYELGLVLMAFDAKGAPPLENRDLERMGEKERREYAFPRELSEAERSLMQECVGRLLQIRRFGLWSYGDGEDEPDLSNTQFALLGLKAAARCRLPVPAEVWGDALKYFLHYQLPEGPDYLLTEPRIKAGGFSQLTASARGWAYWRESLDPADVLGSRVNIGICSLLLCREELEIRKEHASELARLKAKLGKLDRSVRDALAWLAMNFAVDVNPPKADYKFYYLYSLERMGVLTGRRYVGKHDWYREGAEHLLKTQRPEGLWPAEGWSGPLPNTCFALLFFRRATTPSVTTGIR